MNKAEFSSDLTQNSKDIVARLLKAYLDLEQSHEYLRQKLAHRMKQENWSMADVFEACDHDGKSYISVLDLQMILSENKNAQFSLKDIEFLLKRYDKTGSLMKKIGF